MFRKFLARLITKRQLPDNFVFYLHYRLTVWLLVIFSFVVTCKLLVASSFICRSTADNLSFVTRYCYSENVFSSPGVPFNTDAHSPPTVSPEEKKYSRYQTHYSWVNLLFLMHAFNFYLPHLLWKSFESEHISKLTIGLEAVGTKSEERKSEIRYLANYILLTQGKHKIYTFTFIFCEVCNFVIALSHTFWLVNFFDVTGVPNYIPFKTETWSDFRKFYFPSQGKCLYYREGASGDMQKWNVDCLLPLNHLYMLMYVFLYVWYLMLTILAGIMLVYRMALTMSSFRINVITRLFASTADRLTIMSLCNKMSYSDWFFLLRFVRTMNVLDFSQMLDKIALMSQSKSTDIHQSEVTMYDQNYKELDNSSTVTSPL